MANILNSITPKLAACQTNRETALDLGQRGFAVFPITLKEHGDWTPIKSFLDLATTDADQIGAWWREWPDARVGLLCGERNGISVIDIDVKGGQNGFETLATLGFPDAAALSPVVTRTPSGGAHLFFRWDPRVRNWVGKLGAGLDTRSCGGYVLAPGSLKDGKEYRVDGATLGAVDLPAFPEQLVPIEPEREPVETVSDASPEQQSWAAEHLTRLAEELAAEVTGGRNAALNEAACWAGGAAAHGFISEAQARAALESACRRNGMPSREFNATFQSGFKGGLRKPLREFPVAIADDDFEDLPGLSIDAELAELLGDDPPSIFERASSWAGHEPPPRRWLVEGLVPAATVTMLGGDGGTGKSLIALQLAVAVASGADWIGRPVEGPGKAMLLSAEDDRDELHRRLVDSCAAAGVDLSDLDGLLIRSLAGEDALLATLDRKTNALVVTERYRTIERELERIRPAILILDTLADLHSGDENNRGHARQFIGFLRRLAVRFDCVVLLLAHPSLTGMNSGSGLSGSTAWNASVRSRLYFERVKGSDGYEADTNLRILTTKKANYAATGVEIPVNWRAGAFHPIDDLFDDLPGEVPTDRTRRVFLKLLRAFTAQGRFVSHKPSNAYAPAIFAKHPEAEGCRKAAFARAMEELLARGEIQIGEHGRGSSKRQHIEIRSAQDAF